MTTMTTTATSQRTKLVVVVEHRSESLDMITVVTSRTRWAWRPTMSLSLELARYYPGQAAANTGGSYYPYIIVGFPGPRGNRYHPSLPWS